MDTKDKANNSSNELKATLNLLQSKTFKFIFFFSSIGILLIFATAIFNNKVNIYYELANALNMFISIVVGIVAMVMSIISLFFSFYNTKKSYETHDDYLEKFINISNSLDQTMKRQEEYINDLNKLSDKLSTVDNKMVKKFDKMFDMIHNSTFNQLKPTESTWIRVAEDGDWDNFEARNNLWDDEE